MRRLILSTIAFLSISTAIAASAKVDSIPNRFIADEIIAVVGNNTVLLSELNEGITNLRLQYRSQGMTPPSDLQTEALEAILIQKFLAAQAAIDSLPVSEADVSQMTEQALEDLIDKYGSQQEVERRYSRPIFTIRDIILRKRVTEQYLAQAMQRQAQSGVTVTPMEVASYMNSVSADSLPQVPEQYVIAQIVKLPVLDDNARMDIKERLMGYRKRIMDGEISFAVLARMYSDDPMSAIKGGEMAPQPKQAFVGAFSEALEALKPGQISDVVETEFGFHIIELIDRKGENFHCRHILLQLKYDTEGLNLACAQLDSIAGEIREGNITFEEACKQYSDDEKTNKDGGIAINSMYEMYGGPKMKTTRFFREELQSTYDQIRNLEEGGVTNSFVMMDPDKKIEAPRIVKLVKVIPTHTANMKDDYGTLEDMVKQRKQVEQFEEWVETKVAAMFIRLDEPYRSLPLKNDIWIK